MSTEPNLGEQPGPNAKRDAVHVAVVPLINASESSLYRGQRFKLEPGTNEYALPAGDGESAAIGIVDPFITSRWESVEPGKRFWGYLFPGTVSGMRHHWQHPSFFVEEDVDINPHEDWLQKFCANWCMDYDDVLSQLKGLKKTKEGWVHASGRDLHSEYDLGADAELFWYHAGKLLKQDFDEDDRENFGWSCSC